MKWHRIRAATILVGMFIYDLVAASIGVARIVLTRDQLAQPAIVAIPADAKTPWGVGLFAYFISLTPGSTSLHVSDDLQTIYVHMLDAPDDESVRHRFKTLYERWILELERP
ncbi:MAG: Na+/H+ antiporter subunit E [Sphingomonadaceae bacterium]